jgi:hypothetical protein
MGKGRSHITDHIAECQLLGKDQWDQLLKISIIKSLSRCAFMTGPERATPKKFFREKGTTQKQALDFSGSLGHIGVFFFSIAVI